MYQGLCCMHEHSTPCCFREPFFWESVELYQDRMHNGGHKHCSSGFTIARIAFFDALNTEVAEQIFALLDRITNPVSFMRVDNAVIFVRLFFALQNDARVQYWNCTGVHSVSAIQAQRRRRSLAALSDMLRVLKQDVA